MAPGGTFITVRQLVALSIMVMLKDTVGVAREEDPKGGGHHRPLFIVSGLCYTDKKRLSHTHRWSGKSGGRDYISHENNKQRRLLKVSKQRKYWDKHGPCDRIH